MATQQSFFPQLCDIFLTTFWWFPCKLANQNARTVGGGFVKRHVGFPTIDNAASHSHSVLISQSPDATRNHQKVVEKMSKSCQKLCPVATVKRASLHVSSASESIKPPPLWKSDFSKPPTPPSVNPHPHPSRSKWWLSENHKSTVKLE